MDSYPQSIVLLLITLCLSMTVTAQADEAARLQQEAKKVTIIRDDWGIAHVYGKSDADAVFGMIYAQAEDDFNRIETNYLTAMGRMAEAEGATKIWQDLRMRLFIDPVELKKLYATSPGWLKMLMNAWADGLNYYLARHPEVKPRVLRHFEPWMALSFTEGSIGGDIERVDVTGLKNFYSKPPAVETTLNDTGHSDVSDHSQSVKFNQDSEMEAEPSGSNGFAIAPSNTTGHHALLLINPHTSFFFRSEVQMVSHEGLNAYGAATWGQFFIYQGFNDRAGWMHTSSKVDAVDYYREEVHRKDGQFYYTYGKEDRPVRKKQITIAYKTDQGISQQTFTSLFTSHGPVIAAQKGKWVTVKLMNIPVSALKESWLRTKARSYREYRKVMELRANSSNNTIFADADGNIAYFHGNFIPRRDPQFDYTKPVDGSDPRTDWHGLLTVEETPHLLNPPSGYLFNCNNSPWSGAGKSSLRQKDYPPYVDTGVESARGLHAIRVLEGKKDFTLDSLVAAAYDTYLPWFELPIPALLKAWKELPSGSPWKTQLAGQIDVLQKWDLRWGLNSTATSLAVFWAGSLTRKFSVQAQNSGLRVEEFAGTKASGEALLEALSKASDDLAGTFGTWNTPWEEINRFQRLTGDIVQPFNDARLSIPVGFPSGNWGSLASFGRSMESGTKKWYGISGNSFVAVVEFGSQVRAMAVTAGGESGHPESPHFNDQASRYSTGNLREVYFYPAQLRGHTERVYHPGE